MKFKPITDRYKFDSNVLIRDYPDYIRVPIAGWIKNVLFECGIWKATVEFSYSEEIGQNFLDNLNLHFRESFPRESGHFLPFIFEDTDRTTNIIAICLQNYANSEQAEDLERILATGGSAFAVMIQPAVSAYQKGIADLVERVPAVVLEASQEALDNESLICEAWRSCYSRNPDYEKTVSRCCDALEKIWGQKNFPTDPKPQIKKFVHAFKTCPNTLTYKGSSIVNPKNLISDLAESFSDIRGQHTVGRGRRPLKEEAEFVLHYTIFIWNLYR